MDILFIQTGGTIDKDYPKTKNGWAFEINEPAVKRILEKVNCSFNYSVKSLLKKDSLEINDEDRLLILSKCKEAKEDKIIITHGTDTMNITATYLKEIKNKTIIITGAMRPERFSNSDAAINIGVAIGAVQSLSKGIYVAMNGLVIPHHKMERNKETGQFIYK
tara:strand:+ start:110 stop:598 length:489 start_codon:yes stop_codon:yes gene_type:complete